MDIGDNIKALLIELDEKRKGALVPSVSYAKSQKPEELIKKVMEEFCELLVAFQGKESLERIAEEAVDLQLVTETFLLSLGLDKEARNKARHDKKVYNWARGYYFDNEVHNEEF